MYLRKSVDGRGREEAERPDGCCSDVREMLDRDKLLDWPGAMHPIMAPSWIVAQDAKL